MTGTTPRPELLVIRQCDSEGGYIAYRGVTGEFKQLGHFRFTKDGPIAGLIQGGYSIVFLEALAKQLRGMDERGTNAIAGTV